MSALMSLIRYSSIPLIISLSFCLSSAFCFESYEIPRKIVVLYNSNEGQEPDDNNVFRNCQLIFDYYGLVTEYWDIGKGKLPDENTLKGCLGIVTWFLSGDIIQPAEYFRWLGLRIENNIRVIILGHPGLIGNGNTEKELFRDVFRKIGLEHGGDFVANKRLIEYTQKDTSVTGFERAYPFFAYDYEKFTPLREDVKTYLSVRRRDRENSESSVIVTSSTGGYARRGFIIWEDPESFLRMWYINPFLFFKKALGLNDFPKPDPTTLNGNRVAFSHIDGDSLTTISHIDKKSMCGEYIKKYILEKYDFPVTVSVITGEVDRRITGNPEPENLMRKIFRLPNVEPASHSFSHPFYWDNNDPEKSDYDRRYGIVVPGYEFSSEDEITNSVKFVTQNLAPVGKPCRIIQWSGNCRPTEDQLKSCDEQGLLNINGGDTVYDDYHNSYTSVAPIYRYISGRIQFHTGQANENILTNLWTGPFYGYRNIITTFERTEKPYRLKPANIYYHFYSGQYHASLSALQDVYDWVIDQGVAPVFTSDYLMMAKGFITANIVKTGPDSFRLSSYGNCLTFRFDDDKRVPDIARSFNVLGYVNEPSGLYISLTPGSSYAEVVLKDKTDSDKTLPYLKKASGFINSFKKQSDRLVLTYKGFGKGSVELGGMGGNTSYKLTGDSFKEKTRKLKTDKNGNLLINGISTGTLEILPN